MSHLAELRASLVKAARQRYGDVAEPRRQQRPRWLSAGGIVTALAAATAVAVAVLALVALGHRPARSHTTSSPAVTRADLRRAAEQALERVMLPSGAVRSYLVHGTAGLRSPSSRLGIRNSVDVYRLWRLPERPDRVIQFLETHTGGGSSGFSEAGSSAPGQPTVIQQAAGAINLPVTAAGVWRQLSLSAIRLRRGGTELRVDSEAAWLAPRPANQQIPPDVERVVLTWSLRSPRWRGSVTVTNPVQIRRLISAINALPSGGGLCKAAPNRIFRLTFKSGQGNAPLAVATWAPTCRSLGLTIGGRPSVPVMTGSPNAPGSTVGAPFFAQFEQLLLKASPPRRVSSSPTTVHSAAGCVQYGLSTSTPGQPQSAPGAAAGSCTSAQRSRTTGASAP